MPLVDNDRPKPGPEPESSSRDDSWVQSDCLTPIEGCSPRRRASASKTPEQVLELLNARLPTTIEGNPQDRNRSALDSDAVATASDWSEYSTSSDDSPFSVDMTPAPVVIGVDASVDSSSSQPFFTRKDEIPSAPWHEPAAKNTPAEPVASVRVRQMASEREAAKRQSDEPAPVSNVCDDRVVTVTELKPAAQYVPPMRPPESARGHVASQPKVDVVPDCSTKIRTARSLRRQSSVPPAMRKAMGFGHGWPLYIAVAGIACVLAIGVVRNFTMVSPNRPAKSTAQWATPGLEQTAEQASRATGLPLQASSLERNQQDAGLNAPKVSTRPAGNTAAGIGPSKTTGESPANHAANPKDTANSKANLVF
jgi:hypothetical protein